MKVALTEFDKISQRSHDKLFANYFVSQRYLKWISFFHFFNFFE